MKGIVFNLLQACVEDHFSADIWDALLDQAGLTGSYTALGNYPDADLMALVAVASQALGKSADEIVRWFGVQALPKLHARYPGFFEGHANTISFLKTLNGIIHPEVRKLYPGAQAPDFQYVEEDGATLTLIYRSSRNLVAFGEGLILGAAQVYGDSVEISSHQQGENTYHIVCRFGA